jgi:hypothetical protein
VESRTCFPLPQPFISPTRLDWLLLVLPIPAFGKDGISQRTGVVTSIDPGVALTILDQALSIQVTYGAVMLSFLGVCPPTLLHVSVRAYRLLTGALHWGMEFAGLGGTKGYSRLALGAAPVIYAWPTLALDPTMALIAQWVGFTGLWYADLRATSAGWST